MNLIDFAPPAAALEPQRISIDVLHEKYCKGDESTIEALGLKIAFFTDPAGTYIELTQGLRGR